MISFIEHTKGLTKNPLGIIALFVSLIYGFACLVLSTSISNLINSNERLPLIWFIIVFPIIILVGFIFLVTKHHGKLHSPSDYGNAESFLKTLEGARKFEPIQIDIAQQGLEQPLEANQLVKKVEGKNLNKEMFSNKTRENLQMANQFFDEFMNRINLKPYRNKFKELSFAAQAPEYFTLKCIINQNYLISKDVTPGEEIILRVTRDDHGVLNLIAIGKDIIETNAEIFAKKVVEHIDNFATKILKT